MQTCADPAGRGLRMISRVRACLLLAFLCAQGAPLQADSTTPCEAVQDLVEIRAAIARLGPDAAGPGIESAAIRERLDGLDRMALAELRAEEGGGFIGRLVFLFFEILEAVEGKDGVAVETWRASPEFREAGTSLAALSASLSCRRALVPRGDRAPARPSAHPVDFSYVREHWLAAFGLILTALGVAGAVTWWLSRRAERLSRTFSCNVTVHVITETSTCLGSLIEIGRKGGKVRLRPPLRTGARIRIQWDTEWHDAVVAWTNEHFNGLRFSRLVEPRTIEVIRRLNARPSAPDPTPKLPNPPVVAAPSEEIRSHAAL